MSDRISSVVVDMSASPYAHLKPVPVTAVKLTDSFWAPRLRTNRDVTLPTQYQLLEETGRIDNFRAAADKNPAEYGRPELERFVRTGAYYNDSDVYKWLEAASWTLAKDPDARVGERSLMEVADDMIGQVAAAQGPDGYLDTYFTCERESERWTNLRDLHELYCAGHLIQAAVAHHRATGKTNLLRVAQGVADNICALFGPQQAGKRPGTGGHEEIEMALVELARDTGDRKYLDQARFFVDVRGQGYVGGDEYHQDHKPFREFDRMVGHAVRAIYLNAGAADLYAEIGDTALLAALDRMWASMTTRQMYVSGGIGSRYQGEAFGDDYELPNARAYAETCAAIGSVMWNWRMLALSGEARYADLIETTLYNAVLVGLSLDGQSYFYQNPLEDDGSHRRQPWFGCACCPPNIARTLASLLGYFCSTSDEGFWVHLYAAGTTTVERANGDTVGLVQSTRYPWEGAIAIEVEGEGTFSLFLRVPGWCQAGASIAVNGQPFDGAVVPGSYVEVRRAWHAGDTVTLDLPMVPRRVESHPYVMENAGRVALMRGPILYCLEQVDHPDLDLRNVVLPGDLSLSAEFCADLLGGVAVHRGRARVVPPDEGWAGRLYRAKSSPAAAPIVQEVGIRAVPYYAWANREPGAMRVWLRTR